jgi:hypothetical protein
LSTKKTFRIEANAKHRNTLCIISAVRGDAMAGKTMDVTIISCSKSLLSENSGLKAHRTLAPARARYAKSKMMWGGKASLDQFRMAKITEIAASAGQKILFSTRGAMMLSPGVTYINNGDTISA